MTIITDRLLLLIIPAVIALALVVNVAALVGWLRRRTSTNLRRPMFPRPWAEPTFLEAKAMPLL
jgi:hypothetical protein